MSFRRYGARERRGLIILALIVFMVLACGVWYTRCGVSHEAPDNVVTIIPIPTDTLTEAAGEPETIYGDKRYGKGKKKARKSGEKTRKQTGSGSGKPAPRDFMRDTVSPR